jgi:hypothetical protein
MAQLDTLSTDPVSANSHRSVDTSCVSADDLTELERELLELCSMDAGGGETTTTLYVEMLRSPPDRATLEATLRGLVERGLMETWRGLYGGAQRDRITGETSHVVYEDDWWPVTDAGRAAIGLRPRAEARKERWMNPSSGPWRVSPLVAPLCAWRVRHGKEPIPRWYTRLTGSQNPAPPGRRW